MTATDETLATLRSALRTGRVRVEFGTTFSLSQGALPCATIFTHKNDRWVKVKPLLVPLKGGSRTELLRLLAQLSLPEGVVGDE